MRDGARDWIPSDKSRLTLAAALCIFSLAIIAFVDSTPRYQRENWRGAARALGSARVDRALVVTPRTLRRWASSNRRGSTHRLAPTHLSSGIARYCRTRYCRPRVGHSRRAGRKRGPTTVAHARAPERFQLRRTCERRYVHASSVHLVKTGPRHPQEPSSESSR